MQSMLFGLAVDNPLKCKVCYLGWQSPTLLEDLKCRVYYLGWPSCFFVWLEFHMEVCSAMVILRKICVYLKYK
jgi:hypothetical protein